AEGLLAGALLADARLAESLLPAKPGEQRLALLFLQRALLLGLDRLVDLGLILGLFVGLPGRLAQTRLGLRERLRALAGSPLGLPLPRLLPRPLLDVLLVLLGGLPLLEPGGGGAWCERLHHASSLLVASAASVCPPAPRHSTPRSAEPHRSAGGVHV